jgi:RNA polymerase sigma factor (sigma-70 family)
MKKNYDRPWLDSTDVEIPTVELKEICKTWDADTWERYLKWYEGAQTDLHLVPQSFENLIETIFESPFQDLQTHSTEENRQLCEQLFASVPAIEASVLKLIFFEGKTNAEVAAILGRSRTGINDIKFRAITKLKREFAGDGSTTRHLMRGTSSESTEILPSIWTSIPQVSQTEVVVCVPDNYKFIFEEINRSSLRDSMSELSERSQKILYLRFWCNWSHEKIAVHLETGSNVIQQIEDAALSKLKRRMIEIESLNEEGELTWA